MKFAILGGGGCFGLNTARLLLKSSHEVIGCGRSALKGQAFTLGAETLGYRYRTYVVGPDNEFIAEWLEREKPDYIISFAAQGEGAASYKARHWKFFYATNVDALCDLTERLLDKPWLKRFIQVGTSEVYGSVIEPATEEAALKPTSPYAVSKLAFDLHLQSIAKNWGFPAIVVRPSNCLCPGQQLHRVVPKFFLLAMTGRKLPLHGGGKAMKSYMDAEDLSSALLLLAERGEVGQIYNVGPLVANSILGVLKDAAFCMDADVWDLVEQVPDRTGQDSCYWIDSRKIQSLGWEQKISLQTAVKSVHDWVKENLETLKDLPTDYEMRA